MLFIFILVGILFSCNNNEEEKTNTTLIGNWKLIEILADPGDGSGTFSSIESKKTITFKNDGTITSNGMLCNMSINTNNITSGTYDVYESTFNSPDCSNPDYKYTFQQNKNILIINYPCIEPCIAKYIKQ